ncbi:hypothetical protein KCU67_g3729, partial [Aureobasidium melanogenum]
MPNWTESDMAIAMAGIRDESMTYTYVRETYGIPRATIAGRLNGRLERRAAHVSQRRLTKEQEEELAEWIMDLDSRHQPPSQPRCRLMALEIQRASGSDAGLGREWLYQFFNKYPRCGSLLGDPHESVRVNNATEENKDLYELNKENNASTDEKLDMATWIAEKAIQALGHKTVELAKQELKYKTLEFKHIALQEKKGR